MEAAGSPECADAVGFYHHIHAGREVEASPHDTEGGRVRQSVPHMRGLDPCVPATGPYEARDAGWACSETWEEDPDIMLVGIKWGGTACAASHVESTPPAGRPVGMSPASHVEPAYTADPVEAVSPAAPVAATFPANHAETSPTADSLHVAPPSSHAEAAPSVNHAETISPDHVVASPPSDHVSPTPPADPQTVGP